MQNLENNNWIILDPLENIYETHANLTAMTLLNLKCFWITKAELCITAHLQNQVSFWKFVSGTKS